MDDRNWPPQALTTLDVSNSSHRATKEEVLLDLHREFRELNASHFQGRLKVPTIELSTRKTYGGYYQKNKHRIVLSWQAYMEHGWNETLNTFRHEVAHIVYQHHLKPFWDLARQLGVTQKYAASPLAKKKRKVRVYTYQCPSCRGHVQRKRAMRTNASCAKCDSKYNPEFKLQLIRSELR